MAITRFQRRPLRPSLPAFAATPMFDDLENRMRKLFDENFLPFDTELAQPITWLPATDIAETPEAMTITAELPGMDRKDVDISVDDGVLTIRGEKTDTRNTETQKFHYTERTYGSFERTFTLPRTVDATKITAEFGKGVLTIMMPKTVEAKAKAHKIEVNEQK